MSFFFCIDLFLLLHKKKSSSSSSSSFYLSVSLIVCCWRQILDEFRFRLYVRLINNLSTHTVSVFSSSSSSSFLRVELLTLVRRAGMQASYHLSKCVCVHFFLSKHSYFFFIRTYCNFGHIYLYIDGLKENEINDCRMEFESSICIINFFFFFFLFSFEAVKFYNNDYLLSFCF
jgi:hypothetical protein